MKPEAIAVIFFTAALVMHTIPVVESRQTKLHENKTSHGGYYYIGKTVLDGMPERGYFVYGLTRFHKHHKLLLGETDSASCNLEATLDRDYNVTVVRFRWQMISVDDVNNSPSCAHFERQTTMRLLARISKVTTLADLNGSTIEVSDGEHKSLTQLFAFNVEKTKTTVIVANTMITAFDSDADLKVTNWQVGYSCAPKLNCTFTSRIFVHLSADVAVERSVDNSHSSSVFHCLPKLGLGCVDIDQLELLEDSLNEREFDWLHWILDCSMFYKQHHSGDTISALDYRLPSCSLALTTVQFSYDHHQAMNPLPSAITYNKSILVAFLINYALFDHAERHRRPVTDIQVFWTRNGSVTNDANKYCIIIASSYTAYGLYLNISLTIQNISLHDFGLYVCTARCITNGEVDEDRCHLKHAVNVFPDRLTEDVVNQETVIERNYQYINNLLYVTRTAIAIGTVYMCAIIYKAILLHQKRLLYTKVLDDLKQCTEKRNEHVELSYDYDVFVSYSPDDVIWIRQELLPFLELNKFRVCTEDDLEPGKSVLESTATAIYRSRKTIAVLSPNYLASSWCVEREFAISYAKLLNNEGPTNGLLIVKYKECEMPELLTKRLYLDYTRMDRELKSFWMKLKKSIQQ